ncbi:hypothetical protein C2S53_009698 [Perilla frutescens var. hirtella]|uniref:Wound-induced protein 1 n=1 Tax=Perilla frutescens var. hirtella TaxID=608512 RepID=A0AAD4P3L5_PERFH|nr:hypothetical protein C2S53_009698 [Perilla frutescens var. hirtella]
MSSAVTAIEQLYEAVSSGGDVSGLIGSELEWWFHGPQKCDYMMRKLTGKSTAVDLKFEPRNMEAIDDVVIVEGWEGEAYWVHVWTLKNGVITHLREYFNTWLTVTDVCRPLCYSAGAAPLWQSHHQQYQQLPQRSMPGLMLAI